ncbi:threonylcarbamoyl-AMP synthase [Candidatus Uhrbacteria bacterium]|nr:threonylcarbamoyl-AMP synthase [Candidatus Uhrbacteria bacterium]
MLSLEKEEIRKAVVILRKGGVVVFPTETAYGIAADATNTRAVEKVMAIKGRATGKAPPLIVADLKMAEKHALLSPIFDQLISSFWPGPLTIVSPIRKESTLSSLVVQDNTIAVRVSSHPIAQALSQLLNVPIVATSANLAGESPCYDIESVKRQFKSQLLLPDLYLDGGVLPIRQPSTIITEKNGRTVVLRQGEITIPQTYVA